MNVVAISSLLASLVILAIGASVLLRDRTRRTYTAFAAFAFMVSAWHLCNFIAMATRQPLVGWLALWPAATIPPVALRFFREFLAEPSIGGVRRPPRVSLAWTIMAYLALLVSAVFGPWHERLWFQIPFAAYVYGSLYRCVYELFLQYKQTTGRVARTRIRYLMLGGLVAITLSMTDSLPRLGVAWPTLGNVLTILYLYFLSQTLFRFRLLDVHELVGKMVVLGTLVVLLWATYGLLLAWVGGGQEGLFLLNALVASFVILILFEPVRSRLENTINRLLARQQSELRGRLEDVRRTLGASVEMGDMVRRIMLAVEESRRLTHACIYLLDPDGAGHDLVGHHGPGRPLERLDVISHRRLLDRLRAGYVELESLQRERELVARSAGDPDARAHSESLDLMAQTMESMHASLAVPVFGTAETEQGPWLLGLMGFRDERVEDAFDLDDIEVFRRLAGQVALTIENTQVYERVQRARAPGRARRDGRRPGPRDPQPAGRDQGRGPAAGRAGRQAGRADRRIGRVPQHHRRGGQPAEQRAQPVPRLRAPVAQRPGPGRRGGRQRGGAQDGAADGELRGVAASVRIDVRLDDLLPPVAGDAEQLRQVFLNLGLNALQAIAARRDRPASSRSSTTRRRRSRLGYGSFAEVRFRDSGVGIPRDKLKNLFIPFFTTKAKRDRPGPGHLASASSTQHGGTIEVRSSARQGLDLLGVPAGPGPGAAGRRGGSARRHDPARVGIPRRRGGTAARTGRGVSRRTPLPARPSPRRLRSRTTRPLRRPRTRPFARPQDELAG